MFGIRRIVDILLLIVYKQDQIILKEREIMASINDVKSQADALVGLVGEAISAIQGGNASVEAALQPVFDELKAASDNLNSILHP